MANEVAETILSQLGGNRFLVMTGARSLIATANGLQMLLPIGKASLVANGATKQVTNAKEST